MITLYTIGCPKCCVLESKLDAAGIEYYKNTDTFEMEELGIDVLPILRVDDVLLDFKEAVAYVANYEKE